MADIGINPLNPNVGGTYFSSPAYATPSNATTDPKLILGYALDACPTCATTPGQVLVRIK